MASWRLAKSLEKLRDQLNTQFPFRSKVSDGSIGDQAHAARESDHNPNAQGVVTAIDITHDPAHGVDGNILSRELTKDPRMKYVIWNREIFKARTGQWEAYRGANPHNHHAHISVLADKCDDTSSWTLANQLEPPKAEPKQEIISTPTVVVEAEKAQESKPSIMEGIKTHIASTVTFVSTTGAGIVAAVKGFPWQVFIGLFAVAGIVGIAYIVVRNWSWDQEEKRKIERERMAHDLTVLKMRSAMDQNANTVELSQPNKE